MYFKPLIQSKPELDFQREQINKAREQAWKNTLSVGLSPEVIQKIIIKYIYTFYKCIIKGHCLLSYLQQQSLLLFVSGMVIRDCT